MARPSLAPCRLWSSPSLSIASTVNQLASAFQTSTVVLPCWIALFSCGIAAPLSESIDQDLDHGLYVAVGRTLNDQTDDDGNSRIT